MFGSVDEFFYKHLAGIRSPEEGSTTRGYRHVLIHPYIPEDLESVEASVRTVSGVVASAWHHRGDSLQLRVTIPANSDATVAVPLLGMKHVVLTESDRKIWEDGRYRKGAEGIRRVRREKDHLSVVTGSGEYIFVLSGK
jgi:hypothetical protein